MKNKGKKVKLFFSLAGFISICIIGILYFTGYLLAGGRGNGLIDKNSLPSIIYWSATIIFTAICCLVIVNRIIDFLKSDRESKIYTLRVYFLCVLAVMVILSIVVYLHGPLAI